MEKKSKSFTLSNLCGVAFEYKITGVEMVSEDTTDRFDIHPLTIQQVSGVVDVQSQVEFNVHHLPTNLGPFHHQFQLGVLTLTALKSAELAYFY